MKLVDLMAFQQGVFSNLKFDAVTSDEDIDKLLDFDLSIDKLREQAQEKVEKAEKKKLTKEQLAALNTSILMEDIEVAKPGISDETLRQIRKGNGLTFGQLKFMSKLLK